MGSRIVRVIFAILVVCALLVVAAVWMVWQRPLTVDAWMSRIALDINGLSDRTLDTGAGTMSVWEGGSGPTMVLVHGAGDQAGAWARVVGGLVTDHRLVIPDMPGHADSDPSSGPIHMAQLLDGLAAVMDDCCVDEPVVLVGNSMGAWLGFLYALENPDRVERLVAVNGGPLLNPNPNQVNIFPTTREEARTTLNALMGPASPPLPDHVLDDVVRRTANGPAARFAATAAEFGPYLFDGRLDEVEVPVELLWGDADELMTMEYARRLEDGLARARLHPIEGCGHVPHRECPDRFLEALSEALSDPPPEEAPEHREGDDDTVTEEEAGSEVGKQAKSLLHNHRELRPGEPVPEGDAGQRWGLLRNDLRQQAGSLLHIDGEQPAHERPHTGSRLPASKRGLWGRLPACRPGVDGEAA